MIALVIVLVLVDLAAWAIAVWLLERAHARALSIVQRAHAEALSIVERSWARSAAWQLQCLRNLGGREDDRAPR